MTAGVGIPVGASGGAVRLEPMRWWHVEAVAALEASIFDESPWSLEQFYAELAAPGRWLQVVVPDGDARSGSVLGYVDVAVAAPDADLMTIAIAPEVRGGGVGRWLLGQAMGAALAAGARTMFLEVRSDNPALNLYLSQSFEPLDVRRDYYGSGIDAVVMRRRLTLEQAPANVMPAVSS
ncbi:MAG: [ribosomal protein S18]-alanine N-acetyltransferase [Actinomycetota bacterium]|nr:[ribosomal protein S18]-alanine N-acetyltransferase [Actinomycetota bacterium]